MSAMKAYYSLVQYCPDASRLEAVNLGVVLFCPDAEFIAARTTSNNSRAAKLVGRDKVDKSSLNAAKNALEHRLVIDRESFQSLDDFQRFVDSRGNFLKLSSPRPVKVSSPEQELDNLFNELVGGPIHRTRSSRKLPELDRVFHELEGEGLAKLNWEVKIPILGTSLQIPYAYRNGKWNLVKPQSFTNREGSALRKAKQLAVDGDQIYKNETCEGEKQQLIVVSSFDAESLASDLPKRIQNVFEEYHVEAILPPQLDTFLRRVRREAHQ